MFVNAYVLPVIPESVPFPFKVKLAASKLLPPGVPTLKSVPVKGQLARLGVNVFGNPSRYDSELSVGR